MGFHVSLGECNFHLPLPFPPQYPCMIPFVQGGGFITGKASLCPYLEGQGDEVSRLITPVTQIVTLVIPIINLLTKAP